MDLQQHKNQKSIIGYLKLFVVFLLLILFIPTKAQFYNGSQLTFGKNRVQYGERLWFFYRFNKFDTYFYKNGTELAEYTAKYATNQIKEIEEKLDFILEDKIQFIIYNKNSLMEIRVTVKTFSITQLSSYTFSVAHIASYCFVLSN